MPWMYKFNEPLCGADGPVSHLIRLDSNKKVEYGETYRPQLGWCIQVGSLEYWWLTSEIVEVIEDTEYHTVFITKSGSKYFWYEEKPSLEEIKDKVFPDSTIRRL